LRLTDRTNATKFNKVKKTILFLLLSVSLLAVSFPSKGDNTVKTGNDTSNTCSDDPILAMLDSMCTLEFFKSSSFTTDTGLLNVYNFPPDSVPVYDDFIYEYRLGKLDALSPFNLDYNQAVKNYINAYTVQKREKVAQLLGLAQHYFPLMEETLDRYDLPLELKYLAIIESALNPVAKSKSGAMGLWQFIYGTGKMYNLKINSYVDERCDPYLSTVAACEYLKSLYGMFGDWQLVLAAYNGGPGTLNKAIRRSGGKKTYWELRPYLPAETQGYVPAFIAATYMMNYASEHNIYPLSPRIFHYQVDTLHVKNRLSFESLAKVLDITVEDLEYLNPSYRRHLIPATGTFNTLVLPKQKVGLFLANETDLYLMNKEVSAPEVAVQKISTTGEQKKHTIKSGETLSSIAAKYRCSVSDLKDWNNIRGNMIHPGDKLIVFTASSTKTKQAPPEKSNTETAKTNTSQGDKYHTIQKGDTLWGIANQNGITIAELKRLNNFSSDNPTLKIGVKIKVG